VPAQNSRLVASLVVVFALVLMTVVAAGVGGIALVDALRGYTAGEALYSKAQKRAVLALHRYVQTRNPAAYAEYRSLIEVPRNDARARAILEDSRRPRSDSYPYLIGGGNHPDDVAGLAWLFRTFGDTWLFAPAIDIWRAADAQVAKLDAAARELHEAVRLGGPTAAALEPYIWRISAIDDELSRLEAGFSRAMGDAARTVTRMLLGGIVALGALLAGIAGAFAFYAFRRMGAATRLIQEREGRFRDVAEVAVDWIWETGADLSITYVSDRIAEITGFPKERFIGRRRWELPSDPGPQGWQPHIAAVERHEVLEDFEYSADDAFGARRTYRINGKPIFDKDGGFLGYRGTGTDVTAEVAARREAEQKRELLETIFENLGQGVSVVDEKLNVVAFNHRFLELFGIPEGAIRSGCSLESLLRFHAGRGEYGEEDVERAIRKRLALAGSFHPFAFEHRRPDGTLLAVRGQPLPSGGSVTTFRDVTAERKAEAALQESEHRLREVIDRALDAYISINAQGMIIDWNPAAVEIFGWTQQEALGRNLADLVMPERYREQHLAGLRRLVETGRGRLEGRRIELPALRRSGEEFLIELTISAQRAGGRLLFNAFIRDITERKEAERSLMLAKEAAEVANQAKSQFLANMSHELRTPLNAILGFSDIIARRMMGPLEGRYVEYARDIHKSGDHLLALINDILDISSVEAGKLVLEPAPVDLYDVTQSCLELLGQAARSAGVTLVNEVPADAQRLLADPRRLRQILLNLVGNAVKFSHRESSVFVRLGGDAGHVTLEVIDHGIGMAPELVEQVFEPFVQLRTGADRAHEGTGLGLALVRQFVALHGGTIRLESAPGKGTTAIVAFPRARVEAASALPPVERDEPRLGGGRAGR